MLDTQNRNKIRLFTPGPVAMSARTLAIGASQLPYNRTEQFSQITFEIIKDLKYIFGTQKDVVIFAASGTGAMEAVIFNFLDKNDMVLIVNGGTFGQRWVDLCIQHEIPFEQISLNPGQPMSLEDLDHRLSSKEYSTLLINAHETSTGMIYDTKAIGELTQKYGVFFVVDAISTICADIFMTDTQGAGIMNKQFNGYKPWFGEIPQRNSGALVSDRNGKVTTYASLAMVDRGELFITVGSTVYAGMIIGERNRSEDLCVNITREKKLTNMRSATSDATITLRPPRQLSLDQFIEFIAEDELVEVTPKAIRLRKIELDENKRLSQRRKEKLS